MIFLNKDVYIRICELETNVDFLYQQIDMLEEKLKKVEKEKKAIEKMVKKDMIDRHWKGDDESTK